jgi:hypothetical protein
MSAPPPPTQQQGNWDAAARPLTLPGFGGIDLARRRKSALYLESPVSEGTLVLNSEGDGDGKEDTDGEGEESGDILASACESPGGPELRPPGHRCTPTLSRAPLSHSRLPPVHNNRLPFALATLSQGIALRLAWRALVMYRTFLAAIHQRANSAANTAVIIYASFMSDSASVCPRACTSRSREAMSSCQRT